MVERLSKASEKRDLLVLNFGLHFSKTYKEELEQLVQQVGSLCNPIPESGLSDHGCMQCTGLAKSSMSLCLRKDRSICMCAA